MEQSPELTSDAPHPAGYILGIDHGTSGVKVALVTVEGQVVASGYEPTSMHLLPGGGAEQDPQDWWRALTTAVRRMISGAGVRREELLAIAVSSTFSTTVAVDAWGQPLLPALTWMDSRGAPIIQKIMGGFPSIDGYWIPGVLQWIGITGGGPELSGKDDIAHVLYVKHQHPEIYDKTYKFLGSKDYLNLRLTGEFAASVDSIMLFWVTDTRDINNVHYSERLIRRLQIDREKLPELKSATTRLGVLQAEAAADLGLNPGVPVFVSSPDHQTALVGSGAVRDFEGHICVGTSSWVECIVPFKKTDLFHSIASLPAAIPGRYQCINEQDIAGGVLPWLANNFLYHRNELRDQAPPEDIYSLLDAIAGRVPPGSDKVLFAPWLNGERSPVDDNQVRGALFNLSLHSNLDHVVRAFFEGVAFNTRWNMVYVEKFAGRRMDPYHLVGGGAKSKVWCQIYADVLNRTMRQVKDPMWANARGAALIAAVGLGRISFEDIPGLTRFEGEYTPNPSNRGLYDGMFEEFVHLYHANRRIFERLNRQ